MNTLIVNLTRFGDLLQTQPVISGLAGRGDKTALLCLENFLPACSLLSDLDAAYALPGSGLLSALDSGWQPALAALDACVRDVSGFAPERIVNLTSSIPARLLSKLLAERLDASEVLGFSMDEHGFSRDSNSWAAFLEAASGHRGTSPFNVCDLFFRAAHLSGPGRSFNLARPGGEAVSAMAQAFAHAAPGASGFVALQLGASEDRRRWPVAHFARFARLVHRELGLAPVLLGSSAEAGLGERFAALYPHPLVNLIGKTGFAELAAALLACRLLATNDTGTMHLAAGLGLPVMAVFLATAQPFDTAPYAENCLCLEPDETCHPCAFGTDCERKLVCRQAVDPDTAAAWAASRLRSGSWSGPPFPGARAFVTVRDESGQMTLASPTGHDDTPRARWLAVQRRLFRQFLDGESPDATGLTPPGSPLRDALIPALTQAGLILTLLSEQGKLLLALPRDKAKTKFLVTWQRLQTLFAGASDLSALSFLWTEQSQRDDQDLAAILDQAGRFAALVREMQKLFE